MSTPSFALTAPSSQKAASNPLGLVGLDHFQLTGSIERLEPLYRRLGFADEVRALGMPADFPTDIAYFTRFARHELARFSLPSARDARQLVRTLSGSWSAAELPHRCNQKFIEPVLRRHAERLPGVSIRSKSGLAREARQSSASRPGTVLYSPQHTSCFLKVAATSSMDRPSLHRRTSAAIRSPTESTWSGWRSGPGEEASPWTWWSLSSG